MRLITPKRLKENEDAMWALADQVLDDFLAPGKGEFIKGFAGPFTLLVIADLLGVPMEDRDKFVKGIREHSGGGIGGTGKEALAHSPLEFLYGLFSDYVRDRRREPRDDVLTGLATATYPDGSIPEVEDVARVASNVFSAGQETTVRLLGAALQTLGERPDIQAQLRKDRSLIPNFIEESLRIESPVKGDFRMNRVPVNVGGVDLPSGTTVMIVQAAANRDPRRFDDPATFDPARKNARQHISFGRGIPALPRRPVGTGRNTSGDRAAAGPDLRDQSRRTGARSRESAPLPIRSDLHPAWPDRVAPGVHAGMKVWVDDGFCRGHGMCLTLCPEVFTLTDDGYAEAITSEIPTEFEAATREAIECCPEQAIKER